MEGWFRRTESVVEGIVLVMGEAEVLSSRWTVVNVGER